MSEDPIFAALAAMEKRLMTRMNDNHEKLLARLDNLDEHLTLGLGHTDNVEERTESVSRQNRTLGEQVKSLQKLIRNLESRVNGLEDRETPDGPH